MTPIAQRKLEDLVASGYTISGYSVYHEQKHQHGFVTGAGLVGWWKPEGVEYPQTQGEREPVSWIENFEGSISYGPIHEAARKLPEGVRFDLYTHPQPRLAHLTDEQIVPMFSKRQKQQTEGEKDAWYFYAWGVHDGEAAHNIK